MKISKPIIAGLAAIAVLIGLGVALIIIAAKTQPDTTKPQRTTIIHGETTLTKVADGVPGAVDIVSSGIPGDKRIYIVTQAGKIYYSDTDGKSHLFLDISDRVKADGEQGLLGMAFSPSYDVDGYFYVNYTPNADRGTYNGQTIGSGDTLVSRFGGETATGPKDRIDPHTELVILGYDQPEKNHNGGGITFGWDGFFYIASGDGGGSGDRHTQNCPTGNGQCLSTYLGKILRIDPTGANFHKRYEVPDDNPFYKTPGAKPEIWLTGLRNPWRFSFDHKTGDMYIGDVGQGKWEEVDLAPKYQKGLNFGWRCLEGSHQFGNPADSPCQDPAKFTPPIYEYDHSNGQCSITGGYIYRGKASPSFQGHYVFSDYCSSKVYYLEHRRFEPWKLATTVETGFPEKSVSSLGQDNDGELYIALLTGAVYRIDVPR